MLTTLTTWCINAKSNMYAMPLAAEKLSEPQKERVKAAVAELLERLGQVQGR